MSAGAPSNTAEVHRRVQSAVFGDTAVVEVPADVVESATDFAHVMAQSGQSGPYYSKYRNAPASKVPLNEKEAKIAEWAVAKFLKERYDFPETHVDWEIRTGEAKGWRTDLKYPEPYPDVHVKSTSLMAGGQPSWLFQYSNNTGHGGTDPLFLRIKGFAADVFFDTFYIVGKWTVDDVYQDLIVLVFVPPDQLHVVGKPIKVYIKSIVWWKEVVEKSLLRQPYTPRYRGIKLALYYNDLLRNFPLLGLEQKLSDSPTGELPSQKSVGPDLTPKPAGVDNLTDWLIRKGHK